MPFNTKLVEYLRSRKISFYLLLIFVINLVQAFFTGIGNDEAYYWRFSLDADWAYFDHPPMAALMIAAGSIFLPGILGIRFLTVLLSSLTFLITWNLLPEESRKKNGSALLFFLIFLSMPLLNIYSFVTTPDVPLIFFTALYLLIFREFVSRPHIGNGLLLGMVMACLLYSKYHGILVIVFTVVSTPRVLLRASFWLAAIAGICLFLPHLWWQYEHDFVSFDYHLHYRSVLFSWKNIFVYFLNLLIVFNPFILPLYATFRLKKNAAVLTRRLFYDFLFWGFLLFFGFSAFRGHVEPQWVVLAVIPYILYLHESLLGSQPMRSKFMPLAVISLIIILLGRVAIALPVNTGTEFQKRTGEFYHAITDLADGRPVVFVNSYTEASRFSYYTGQPSFSYNFVSFRKNQYDIWDYHQSLHGRDVLLVMFPELSRFKSAQMPNGETIHYGLEDDIPIVNNIAVEILAYDSVIAPKGKLTVRFRVSNPYDDTIYFNDSERKLQWILYFLYPDIDRAKGSITKSAFTEYLPSKSVREITLDFDCDIKAGFYTIGMHLLPQRLFPISVSKRTYPIEVSAAKVP